MKGRSLRLCLALMFLALWARAEPFEAPPLLPEDVPEALRGWIPWVAQDRPGHSCVSLPEGEGAQACLLLGRFALRAEERGGGFTLEGENLSMAPVEVPLPGRPGVTGLTLADGRLPVLVRGDRFVAVVPRGAFNIEGRLVWSALPTTLAVPGGALAMEITALGRPVGVPADSPDLVQLASAPQPAEEEDRPRQGEVRVRRWVQVGRPVMLESRYLITCPVKEREIALALPEAFLLESIEAPAPLRRGEEGTLLYQCPVGHTVVSLKGRLVPGTASLAVPQRPSGEALRWEDEVWVFSPDGRWKSEVSGGAEIEPSVVTDLPQEWRRPMSSTWQMASGRTMAWTMEPLARAGELTGRFTVRREVVAGEKEGVYWVEDRVGGTSEGLRSLSLETKEFKVEGIRQGGDSQIFLDEAGRPGVQLRSSAVDFSTTMLWEGPWSGWAPYTLAVPAAGWSAPFQEGAISLALKPGWSVLSAWGAEDHSGDLFSLIHLFTLLMAVMAFALARAVGGWVTAILAGLVALTAPWVDFPSWAFLALLALFCLLRLLADLRTKRVALVRWTFRLLVMAALIPVIAIVSQWPSTFRFALHPAFAPAQASYTMSKADRFAQVAQAPPMEAPSAPMALEEREKKEKVGDRRGYMGWEGKMGGKAKRPQRPPVLQQDLPTQFEAKQLEPIGRTRPAGATGQLVTWSYHSPLPPEHGLGALILPPLWRGAGMILHVLATALTFLMMTSLWPKLRRLREIIRSYRKLEDPPKGKGAGPAVMALLGLLVLPGLAVAEEAVAGRGDYPPEAILEELADKLWQRRCPGGCAAVSDLVLKVEGKAFVMEMLVYAVEPEMVKLPGPWHLWQAKSLKVGGQEARGLRMGAFLVVLAPAGRNVLRVEGEFHPADSPRMALPMGLAGMRLDSREWRLEGGDDEPAYYPPGKVLTLVPTSARDETEDQEGQDLVLSPGIEVIREIRLGRRRTMTTRVEARGLRRGDAVDLPLLHGEALVDHPSWQGERGVRIPSSGDRLHVSYQSLLPTEGDMVLQASEDPRVLETWSIFCEKDFSCSTDQPPEPALAPDPVTFYPGAGQRLTVKAAPLATARGNLAEGVNWHWRVTPGLTMTRHSLSGTIRHASPAPFSLQLPVGAEVTRLGVNGEQSRIRPDGEGKLEIKMDKGATGLELEWNEPRSLETSLSPTAWTAGLPVTNMKTTISLDSKRVVLYAWGKATHGTKVFFWAVAMAHLIIALLAFSAARRWVPRVPFQSHHWILFLVPLASFSSSILIPLMALLLFIALPITPGRKVRWARLIFLSLAVVVAAILFTVVIYWSMLERPDMTLVSSVDLSSSLLWLQSQVPAGEPPLGVGVLSLPLWAWQSFQFLWCVWLLWLLKRWIPVVRDSAVACLSPEGEGQKALTE